jgi:hypothetical protein
MVVGACAGDLQYWDISDRGDPTSEDGEPHTLIQREVEEDDPATPEDERWESFDFVHNATVTWDGQVVAAVDESGGGVRARCDGAEASRPGATGRTPDAASPSSIRWWSRARRSTRSTTCGPAFLVAWEGRGEPRPYPILSFLRPVAIFGRRLGSRVRVCDCADHRGLVGEDVVRGERVGVLTGAHAVVVSVHTTDLGRLGGRVPVRERRLREEPDPRARPHRRQRRLPRGGRDADDVAMLIPPEDRASASR